MQMTKVEAKKILPTSSKLLGAKNLYEKDYEAWKELRKKGIGGSDIGALIGVNKYNKPIDIYLDKIGLGTEFEGNYKTDFGNWQEPYIAERFEREHSDRYDLYELEYTIQKGHLIANVDRILYDKKKKKWGILEIKTAGEQQEMFWTISEEEPVNNTFIITGSPDSYYAQTQLYLEVTKFDFAIMAGVIGRKYFESKPYTRNDLEGEMISDVAETFFTDNVLEKEPPKCDGTDQYTSYLKGKYPASKGNTQTVILCEEENDNLKAYIDLYNAIKHKEGEIRILKRKMEKQKQLLLLAMGDSNNATGEAGTIKKSSHIRSSIDKDGLKQDLKNVKTLYPECFGEGLLKDNYMTLETLVEGFKVKQSN